MGALAVLRHPLLWGGALLYASFQLVRHWLRWPLPTLLTSYLGDALCLLLLLGLALAAHRACLGNGAILPGPWVLAAWLSVAVWFEVLLPWWSARAVADPLDVLAYGVGALVFMRWLNQPARHPR